MKKVEFNKVTWYSKLAALIVFVGMPFVAFYFGVQYDALVRAGRTPAPQLVGPTAGGNAGAAYYRDPSSWQVGNRDDAGFSLSYPLDFPTNDIYKPAPGTDWRLGANENPGELLMTLTIPKVFQPRTNFDEARLTVGKSTDAKALADCMTVPPSGAPGAATSTVGVGGVLFLSSTFADAGAGNLYDTTSYRTVHGGACWAIEYTIHSSQIGNYPSEYGLMPFKKGALTDVLDRIVGTFRFK